MPVAENFNQILKETAAGYLQLGWSVVPVWGDTKPDQAKVAAVAWSAFQRRRANQADVERWFSHNAYKGLGIVTGAVSGLAVLDFDAADLVTAFERALPELSATRTVLTRRGCHLYFRVPPHLRIASRKLNGVDLLSDGHYVVAPPTTIDGHEYRVGRGGQPKTLTQFDLDRINAFLDCHCAVESAVRPTGPFGITLATPGGKPQEGAFSCEDESLPQFTGPDTDSFLTAEALVHFYQALARQSGRNSALFKTSCLARDHSWKFEAVAAVLAVAHADALPTGRHRHENRKARHREALRTIRSVFSQPPRPLQPKVNGGLFNSIREKLIQMGQTFVVRVLEGLRLAGIKAGQLVSEKSVLNMLRGLVGRRSIRQSLAAKTPSGQAVFERVNPLSALSPSLRCFA